MSWRNILLGHEPLRKALAEAERLDQGSPFEHEAINLYGEASLRRNFGVQVLMKAEQETGLVTLCKAEAKQAMPSLTDKELDDLAQLRISHVKELSESLATMTKAAFDGFQNKLYNQTVTAFTEKMNETFSDDAMDAAINVKLGQLKPSVSAEILRKAGFDYTGRREF